jgi:hypothetical protein
VLLCAHETHVENVATNYVFVSSCRYQWFDGDLPLS